MMIINNLNIKNSLLLLFICISLSSFSQNYKFGKVSKEEVLQKEHPIEKDADASILYRELVTKFDYNQDDGFYITTYVHERIKIYSKEGFDWATKTVNLYQGNRGNKEKIMGLKGFTYYMEDGKLKDDKLRNDGIFEEEISDVLDRAKFTMPNLSEGCVIEYKYEVKSSFIDNIDAYRLQEKIPVDKVEVVFSTPEYLNYKTYQKGVVPFKITTNGTQRKMRYSYTSTGTGGFSGGSVSNTSQNEITFLENSYRVNLTDVPSLKEEPYAGNIENYLTSLKFELSYTKFPKSTVETYSTSWEAVSKSIYNNTNFKSQISKNNYFEDDVNSILEGVTNEDEKMIRIFEFVKQKVRWNNYNGYFPKEGSRDAYKNGSGNVADINLLLIAMLKSVGINANPILLSTKANGIPIFPTRNGFNYVIAGVEKDNSVLLLDATNRNAEVNILDSKVLNWQGRIIREDGSSAFVPLYPSKSATKSSLLKVDVNSDLSVTGNYQVRYTDQYALKNREQFSDVSNDDVRKKLESEMNQIELSNVSFKNLDELYKPVNLSCDFESLDAADEIGGKIYISPLLFEAMEENPFKLEKREYPIDFGYPFKDRLMVTMSIPEGYTVESVPEAVSFALPGNAGSFIYEPKQIGSKLQMSVEFSMNVPMVSPTFYEGLKTFYQMIIDKENEKVVLVKS